LYLYIHHLYEQGDLFNLENGSSGIKNLNYKALLFDLEYKIPNEQIIIQFNKDIEQYFYKINKKQTPNPHFNPNPRYAAAKADEWGSEGV